MVRAPSPGEYPRREAVVLGGVGVHDEDLRVRAVLFDAKGQWVLYLCRDVRRRLPGVVLDAARAAGNILFTAALRVVFLDDSARAFGPGVVAQKLHKIAFDAACRDGGFGQRGGSLGTFGGSFGHGCGLLRRAGDGLSAQGECRLRRRDRPGDDRRQPQHKAVGRDGQSRKKGRCAQKGQQMALPGLAIAHRLPPPPFVFSLQYDGRPGFIPPASRAGRY